MLSAMILVIRFACILVQMVILKADRRNAVMIEALAIQKTIHAAATVKVVFTAMFFAVLFACVIKQMVIVGACRG